MSVFHHFLSLQNLKIIMNWCREQSSQLSSMKFGDKKLEQFFCMKLFSVLIYYVSKSNGNVFFGVIWCETHCNRFWLFNYLQVLLSQYLACPLHVPEHSMTSPSCPTVVPDLSWSCPKNVRSLLQHIKKLSQQKVFLKNVHWLYQNCPGVILEMSQSLPEIVLKLSQLS